MIAYNSSNALLILKGQGRATTRASEQEQDSVLCNKRLVKPLHLRLSLRCVHQRLDRLYNTITITLLRMHHSTFHIPHTHIFHRNIRKKGVDTVRCVCDTQHLGVVASQAPGSSGRGFQTHKSNASRCHARKQDSVLCDQRLVKPLELRLSLPRLRERLDRLHNHIPHYKLINQTDRFHGRAATRASRILYSAISAW